VTIPDPISDLVALLREDSAVAALAGENVFGGGLPHDARIAMPQPAVVVKPAGGPGRRGYNLYRTTRIDTVCYGTTLKQSWDLHLAVRELLEELRRPGAIFWVTVSSDGANAIDPVEQWPTCFASYLVMSAIDP
jgi:hypothetical protein